MPSNPHELLPLKPLVFHILLVLVSGERHGYSIVKEVAAQTDGQRPDPDMDDQRRRYFQVTPLGKEVLRAEALRMERLSLSAKAEFEAAGSRRGER